MYCGAPKQNFGWAMAHPAYPAAPHGYGEGSAVSSPSGVRGRAPTAVAFCCIECSQNASERSISGSLVSVAMSGKMKANPGPGRIWYLLATYAI